MHGTTHGRLGILPSRAGLTLATRRAEVLGLLREFSTTVARPGAGRDARLILHRTIHALEARLAAEAALEGPLPPGLTRSPRDPLAVILAEIKGVAQRWDASEEETVPADFAHALDSLLMYEVQEDTRLNS